MTDSLSDLVQRVLAAVMVEKEDLVAERGIGEDLRPRLLIVRDAELAVADLAMLHSVAESHSIVASLIKWMRADEAVFVHEMYQLVGTEAATGLTSGDFARRFAAGDQNVREALLVVHMTPAGCTQLMMPYRYQGRRIEWLRDACLWGPSAPDSLLAEAARRGFAAQDVAHRVMPLAEAQVVFHGFDVVLVAVDTVEVSSN
jgi:hypothetical protein